MLIFSKEAEAYDNGEVINTVEDTTQVEKKEEPVKGKTYQSSIQ